MTPDDLAATIALHDRQYHELGAPLIADAAYDELVAQLRALDPDHPALQRLGHPVQVDDDAKVDHRVPMLSLDKCTTAEEFLRWARNAPGVDVVGTPKVDGLACTLRYGADGRLELAATRGDGARGENVTRNILQMPSVPNPLPAAAVSASGGIEVRGEVYLPLATFRLVEDQFMSPRNLAAGVLKAKDSPALPPDQLAFLAYDVLGLDLSTKRDRLARLAALGFDAAPHCVASAEAAPGQFAQWTAGRADWPYETDGVVFEFDDTATVQRLGTTAHHPRGAIAWKFGTESGRTTLVEVQWSVSRTGTITPVAIVEPVALSGASITRATLHNLSNLRRLALKVGDTLDLVRRGGVIPHVEASHGGGHTLVESPLQCPACGSPTTVTETTRKVAEDVVVTHVLRCTTPTTCTLARRRALLHFCQALELDGFGEKVIDVLMDQGLARDPADLYALQAADLEGLPRFGKTMVQNLLAELERTRSVDLAVFLRALGIESLGKQTANLLAARWDLDALLGLEAADLAKLHSLDVKTGTAIVDGLGRERPLIDRLRAHIEVVRPQRAQAIGPFAGEVVVFTGALQRMGRRDAQQAVVRMGGLCGDSVTNETTLVVVGGGELEAALPSSKLKKARKLVAAGQPLALVDESVFYARVGLDG
ncbi:MAG: DNA ligase (NAD(+)) LigA [Myxococcales bacterium]|nr:DNA ligase (NAD(+)) LigA [Myxococcales bacterium]